MNNEKEIHSPVVLDTLKEPIIYVPDQKLKYVTDARHSLSSFIWCNIFSLCSGTILDKDGKKSHNKSDSKEKPRAAGPLEIVSQAEPCHFEYTDHTA